MTELKPCKCHAIPIVKKEGPKYGNFGLARGMFYSWRVVCPNCGEKYGDFLGREIAVKAWNRRENNEYE